MSDGNIYLDFTIHHPYLAARPIEHANDDARRVLEIVARNDATRIDAFGGYPSEVMFIFEGNGAQVWPSHVAIASVIDGTREPTLTLLPLSDYISSHSREESDA